MTSNHFWGFEISKHGFCFAVLFCYANVLVYYVLSLDSCVVASKSVFESSKIN